MRIKTVAICAAVSSFLAITSAFAQKSSIEGTATGPAGQPLKNADVRIQQENTTGRAVLVKTDGRGHFAATGLAAGTYTVAIVANGVVKSSVEPVTTKANQTAQVNFTTKATIATGSTTQKRSRYIQPPTGSHMGGWQDPGKKSTAKSTDGLDSLSGEQLTRMQAVPQRTSSSGGR